VRRLLRILLNTATVLSLLLFGATVVLWVRSYQISDLFDAVRSVKVSTGYKTWFLSVDSTNGGIGVSWAKISDKPDDPTPLGIRLDHFQEPVQPAYPNGGFISDDGTSTNG
jgi:hypothetical protein